MNRRQAMTEGAVADHELIYDYLGGKEASFEQLYRRYRLPLYGFINGLVPGRRAVADDLFQQTWVRVLDALPEYRDQSRFFPWLARIAHNLAMDFFRASAQSRQVDAPENLEAVAGPAEGGEPWQDWADGEFRVRLERAIDQLSVEQREVLLLRRQGVPFKEIAGIQGTGINTVLGRMHYAVNRLRRQLRLLEEG
jgi:RNA polymerase sigma-70 factor, ECF subfamily